MYSIPITYYLLPITYYLLPITYYLLPITQKLEKSSQLKNCYDGSVKSIMLSKSYLAIISDIA